MPPTGDLACNPGMCSDWELNQWPFGSQAGTPSTEPHQPGLCGFFLHSFNITVQAYLAKWKFSYCWNCLQDSKKKSLQHIWDDKEFGWKKTVIDAFSLRSIVVTLAAQPKSYYLALEVLEGKNVLLLWRAVWHRKTSPSIRLFLGTRTIETLFLQNRWNTLQKPSV